MSYQPYTKTCYNCMNTINVNASKCQFCHSEVTWGGGNPAHNGTPAAFWINVIGFTLLAMWWWQDTPFVQTVLKILKWIFL